MTTEVKNDQLELEMLREFFKSWKQLHSIPKNNVISGQIAAQRLIDLKNDLEALIKQG